MPQGELKRRYICVVILAHTLCITCVGDFESYKVCASSLLYTSAKTNVACENPCARSAGISNARHIIIEKSKYGYYQLEKE